MSMTPMTRQSTSGGQFTDSTCPGPYTRCSPEQPTLAVLGSRLRHPRPHSPSKHFGPRGGLGQERLSSWAPPAGTRVRRRVSGDNCINPRRLVVLPPRNFSATAVSPLLTAQMPFDRFGWFGIGGTVAAFDKSLTRVLRAPRDDMGVHP